MKRQRLRARSGQMMRMITYLATRLTATHTLMPAHEAPEYNNVR